MADTRSLSQQIGCRATKPVPYSSFSQATSTGFDSDLFLYQSLPIWRARNNLEETTSVWLTHASVALYIPSTLPEPRPLEEAGRYTSRLVIGRDLPDPRARGGFARQLPLVGLDFHLTERII